MAIGRILLFGLLPLAGAGGWGWFVLYPQWQEAERVADVETHFSEARAEARKCAEGKEPCPDVEKGLLELLPQVIALDERKPDVHAHAKGIRDAYESLASIAGARDDVAASSDYLDKLRVWDPQNPVVYARLARRLVDLKRYRDAVRYARLATQIAPLNWQSFHVLALIHLDAHEVEEARGAMDEAIRLAPFDRKDALAKELESRIASIQGKG